jgi:hypothetical protein
LFIINTLLLFVIGKDTYEKAKKDPQEGDLFQLMPALPVTRQMKAF